MAIGLLDLLSICSPSLVGVLYFPPLADSSSLNVLTLFLRLSNVSIFPTIPTTRARARGCCVSFFFLITCPVFLLFCVIMLARCFFSRLPFSRFVENQFRRDTLGRSHFYEYQLTKSHPSNPVAIQKILHLVCPYRL